MMLAAVEYNCYIPHRKTNQELSKDQEIMLIIAAVYQTGKETDIGMIECAT